MIENGRRLEDTKESFTPRKPTKAGGWGAAIFIIFVEMAERFAFLGLASNLITYLTEELKEPNSTAVKNVNTWLGVSYLFPILGAYIADSFFGRFNTILVASIIYCTGMALLASSVSLIPLRHRKALFFTALYIIAVGEGGHKPCVQTFAADQFDEDLPEEKKAKSSFFNWWYLGINIGATSAVLVVVYIEDNVSWAVGFGALAAAMAVSLLVFLLRLKRYNKQGPLGSPFTTVAQVLMAAARKWRVEQTTSVLGVCCDPDRSWVQYMKDGDQTKGRTLVHTNQMSESRNPWRLCSLNQMEEVKLVLRLIPIWLCSLMFAVNAANFQTYFTKQGSTMNQAIGPHFQLPAASLQALLGITITVVVPVYDRVLVPIARRFTGHLSGITMLQRIGIGLFLSSFNMAVSAVVEAKRVSVAKEHNLLDNPKAMVPMLVWWLLPQYILSGLADVFTFVGFQELFYAQMPELMRSLGAAAYVSVVGVGSFANSAVISIVQAISSSCGEKWLGNNLNRAHLDYHYWVLVGMSALNLCVCIAIARRFMYMQKSRRG